MGMKKCLEDNVPCDRDTVQQFMGYQEGFIRLFMEAAYIDARVQDDELCEWSVAHEQGFELSGATSITTSAASVNGWSTSCSDCSDDTADRSTSPTILP